MLVLTRAPGDRIVITGAQPGDTIIIELCSIKGQRARIGTTAPEHVTIDREEIHKLKEYQRDAS